MVKTSSITEPYFSHDIYPQADKKIVLLIDEMGYEGYGLYWKIVEFMHRNKLNIGEERLVAGREFSDKVSRILNDFHLFRKEGEEYVSDRILRNINKQEEEFEKKSKAANTRWILGTLKKNYIEIFDKEPVLDDKEIQALMKYANKIDDFKDKLPDILFTTKLLKFDNNPKFNPCINWLLAENHLGKLLNGEYGKLKSWSKHKEALKKAELSKEQEELQENNINPDLYDTKIGAIEFIAANNQNLQFINPAHKELMKKFDISIKELQAYKEGKNV